MQTLTIKANLVAKDCDVMGYINYVFELFDYKDEWDRYIMCVRFPNWNHSNIEYEIPGYLTVRYVEEGVDKWYDGVSFNTYNYTNIIFMKFIEDK